MSADSDAIRRQLGMDLIAAERRLQRATQSQREKVKQPDQRKQQDEQCQGVDGELLKGVVLGVDAHRNLFAEIKEGFDALRESRLTGVAIGATSPELLPPGTLCFGSLDDYLAWCDKEDGSLD